MSERACLDKACLVRERGRGRAQAPTTRGGKVQVTAVTCGQLARVRTHTIQICMGYCMGAKQQLLRDRHTKIPMILHRVWFKDSGVSCQKLR